MVCEYGKEQQLWRENRAVLILVLMEDGLRVMVLLLEKFFFLNVLILVLMEDGLRGLRNINKKGKRLWS